MYPSVIVTDSGLMPQFQAVTRVRLFIHNCAAGPSLCGRFRRRNSANDGDESRPHADEGVVGFDGHQDTVRGPRKSRLAEQMVL